MKRFVGALLALVMVFALNTPADAVSTNASCAILMDAGSGRILYEQNIHETRLIASITKLMTALVTVEHTADLDESVTVKGEWLGSEGSSIYLKPDEEITVRGLLYGLLLQSGNDAAMVLACHVAGDMESFVALMNDRARELGMNHTGFANPSGLNAEGHYSTAYDMALLACACLDNQQVAAICATKSITIGTRTFVNHNRLLFQYEGCVGMKTGYTERSGRTLVSAARRDGQTLVCVTLNDRDDWNDHTRLFDYGFENYPSRTLCEKGQVMGYARVAGSFVPAVPLVACETVTYPLAEGESLEMTVGTADILPAPVKENMPVSCVLWSRNGQPAARVDLVTGLGAQHHVSENLSLGDRVRQWLSKEGEHGRTAAKTDLRSRYLLSPQGRGAA